MFLQIFFNKKATVKGHHTNFQLGPRPPLLLPYLLVERSGKSLERTTENTHIQLFELRLKLR